jgi:hypothetical protein
MSDRPKRIKAPEGPPPARVIADAIDRVTEAIRESFGPRVEMKIVHDEFPELINSVHAFETREEQEARLKREIRDRVLYLCGWEDGGEVTADGSADNDLAQERADEIMALIDFVRGSGYPGIVAPVFAPASVEQVKQTIRHLLLKITKNDDDAKPTRAQLERTDTIEAFISLARTHPEPRRLMPRGDRTGDWLPPGTRVTVLGQYPGVVEPELDMVRVKLDAVPTATSFPRNSIVKEGEEWTPPKPTA